MNEDYADLVNQLRIYPVFETCNKAANVIEALVKERDEARHTAKAHVDGWTKQCARANEIAKERDAAIAKAENCKRDYADLGRILEERTADRDAAIARVERLEAELRECDMTEIPDDVLFEALDVRTKDCHEGIQYVLIRGLAGMGFAQPSAETVELMRAALAVAVEWARKDERENFVLMKELHEALLELINLQQYAKGFSNGVEHNGIEEAEYWHGQTMAHCEELTARAADAIRARGE